MSKRNPSNSSDSNASPNWRGIRQQGRLKPTSAAAREKRFIKWKQTALLGGLTLFFLAATAFLIVRFWVRPAPDTPPTPTERSQIEEVVFESDGVLSEAWFRRSFPFDATTPIRDFDIYALKKRLEAHGQVTRAEVGIALPSTLHIRVEERVPVLRARVRDPAGEVKILLIAADGTAYEGDGYPVDTLRHLPGLAGATPRWSEGQILPFPGVNEVAALLQRARDLVPELYAEWRVVSFERFDGNANEPDALIFVKSRFVERIVFAPRSFDPQLRKLNEVVMVAREQNVGGLKKVDVSFPDQAIVEYP